MRSLFLALLVTVSLGASAESPERGLQEAQAKLNALGYEAGTADGVMGPATARAIRNFQRVVGLGVTGEYDAEVAAHLFQPCQIAIVPSSDPGKMFAGRAGGGCHKPQHVEGSDYKVCTRESGDCSVPGPNGVTDALVVTLESVLE